MTDQLKKNAALAALNEIPERCWLGVGTGSTVNFLIDALPGILHRLEGTIASSKATEARLKALKIPVFDLNTVPEVTLYIDGADEVNAHLQLIKGGGGALTREKILAFAARHFICIADESKSVKLLGTFPLPVEVIPMARSLVGREMVKLGGDPEYRDGFVTDNGNIILDIHNLDILEPIKLETQINQIPGVVCHGLFASKPADTLILATKEGVKKI